MKYEMIQVVDGQVEVLPKPLEELKSLQRTKILITIREEELKQELLNAMEKHGIKKVENDLFSATYIEPSERITIDSKKLKQDQPKIAEEYSKVSKVKSSVRVKFNEPD